MELYIAYGILILFVIFVVAPMIGSDIVLGNTSYKQDLLAGLAFLGFILVFGVAAAAVVWAVNVVFIY